jgi:heat shock protein HtpX
MNINHLKTVVLLGLLTYLLLFLGNLFGGTTGVQIALLMAFLCNGIAYFFSDKMVLSIFNAQPLDQYKHKEIYQCVHELSIIMDLPMPKLWFIDSPMANAFATGRNPSHASIAITRGLLEALDPDELKGVLAHELGHILNRDILVTTVVAIIAGAIGYVAYFVRSAAWWGSFSGGSRNEKRDRSPFIMIIASVVVPVIATLIQLAISRSREYLADYTGSCLTQAPLSLAHALQKLEHHATHKEPAESKDPRYASMAALFIVHPAKRDLLDWKSWFATHPPIHKRVEKLEALHRKLFSYYAQR